MAFPSPATGDTIQATHITDIVQALDGTSGQGVAIALTALNSTSSYALDVRNLDTTNGYLLRVRDGNSNSILDVVQGSITATKKLVMTGLGSYTTAANMLDIAATWNGGAQTFEGIKLAVTNTASAAGSLLLDMIAGTGGATTVLALTALGKLYLNDSSNANMTQGLTINQGGNDNECLTLKSSDVTHGMTGITEADTYGVLQKQAAATGGLVAWGFSSGTTALQLAGYHTTDDTTKSTAGVGAVIVNGALRNGTAQAVCGADANLVVIRNLTTTRFIFDAEGSFHADVESTTFDEHDDLALLEALDTEFKRRKGGMVGEQFRAWLAEHKATLQRERVANFYDEGGPRVMLNMTRLAMLHTGALRQIGQRLALAEARLAALPAGGQ